MQLTGGSNTKDKTYAMDKAHPYNRCPKMMYQRLKIYQNRKSDQC